MCIFFIFSCFFKNFFNNNAKKIFNKALSNFAKINKLNNNIKKIYFDKLINDIKNHNYDEKKKNGILNGSDLINEKIKNLMTKRFIKKWKYKNKNEYNKKNNVRRKEKNRPKLFKKIQR